MASERKLAEWHRAGLIDSDTAARIKAYEDASARPLARYAVGGVGAVAIVLGLVAMIASNWEQISGHTKLAIDLLVGVAVDRRFKLPFRHHRYVRF